MKQHRATLMATQIKPETKSVYERDFYVWTEVQTELLRQRRFDELDLDHPIEEVEGLGDSKKSAVLSNATVVIEHLLKLQHSPATDPRPGWVDSILEHRNRLEYDLTPRLRQLPRVYAVSRRTAERRLRVDGEAAAAAALPATCPYVVDQIIGDWWP
jgi:Domain of unknown function DUF29